MGEKMQYSSSSQQASFHGCCARPSFLSIPCYYYHDSSSSSKEAHHDHSPKTTTIVSTTTSTSTNNNNNNNCNALSSSSQYKFIVATLCSLHPNTNHYFTNHESLPSLQQSFSYFTNSFPQFSNTQQADRIRSREYFHLALSNLVCLDYIGLGLFSCSSSKKSQAILSNSTSDNTSINVPSSSSSDRLFPEPGFFSMSYNKAAVSEVELKMRKRIMEFMNVSEEDYTMVFTSNQSSAFKLVVDSYPFQSHRNLLTVYDHHNEGLGIAVDSSKKRGARVLSAKFSWPSMRIGSRKLRKLITSATSTSCNRKVKTNKGLFVFPLQSRMTGSRYSYQWMSVAKENGWHVLLDACALGPKDMETLGLSLFKPDFLVCSFYKVFAQNPSGFGCLFVKKSSSPILTDSTAASTSIGIISLVPTPPPSNCHDDISETFDHTSTLECDGLDHADSLGLVTISTRSRCLINWLVNALTKLRHPCSENDNKPLIRIYGPSVGFDRGPSLAFNVFDWKGEKVDPILVQKLADRNNISLGYGFLEHVSFVDKSEEDRERRVETRVATTTSDHHDHRDREVICSITATLGLVTNFEDVYRLWAFVARFLDADFVEKERWRYLALNQTTIEV